MLELYLKVEDPPQILQKMLDGKYGQISTKINFTNLLKLNLKFQTLL